MIAFNTPSPPVGAGDPDLLVHRSMLNQSYNQGGKPLNIVRWLLFYGKIELLPIAFNGQRKLIESVAGSGSADAEWEEGRWE